MHLKWKTSRRRKTARAAARTARARRRRRSPMAVEPAVAILTEADHAVIDAVQRAARQLHESARNGATPSTDDLPVDGAPGWRLR